MSNTTLAQFVAQTAQDAAIKARDEGGDFQEQMRAAMTAAHNHWMVTAQNEEEQFQGAVAAIYILADAEQKVAIMREIDFLKHLAAASQGIAVDFSALLPGEGDPEPPPPVGLQKMWNETRPSND